MSVCLCRIEEEWVEELTAGLQSGALSFPDLYREVSKAAGERRLVPRGLDDLIDGAACVRAGLPLPSRLFGEGGGGEARTGPQRRPGRGRSGDEEEGERREEIKQVCIAIETKTSCSARAI